MISTSRIAGLVATVAGGAVAYRQLTGQSETVGGTDAMNCLNCYYSPTQDQILIGDNPHLAADHERACREFLSSYPHGIPWDFDFGNNAYHLDAPRRMSTLENSDVGIGGYYDFSVGIGVFYDTVNQECREELPLE